MTQQTGETRLLEDDTLMRAAAEPISEQTERAEQSASPVVAGVQLEIDCAGTLWWPDERLLVVSDLHLEKGSSHAERGMLIPPYDTAATLAKLAVVIARRDPARVISLGDSFHDRRAASRLSGPDLDALTAIMQGRDWIWISGNHDPEAPDDLDGTCTAELAIGPLVFRHEPRAGNAPGEIAGHLHPAARVRARGRSVRRRCLASDGHRAILPAFGAYTGGLNLRSRPFDSLFDASSLNAWMLGDDAVYRVPLKRLSPGV
ncbi:MAG: ligase-associated DNA damage response endonuclease PdeM [Pseudomonadota bacterium]